MSTRNNNRKRRINIVDSASDDEIIPDGRPVIRSSADFVSNNQIPMESVANLYMNSSTADVHFVFETEGVRIPAHKSILAGASDVFKTMFYGELPEKGDVKIVGTTAKSFTAFIQFFYFSQVKLNEENVAEVMALGHRYNVTKCVDICVNFLKIKLNSENVCMVYRLAILYELADLKQICERKIVQNLSDVFKSKSFLESHRTVLDNILKMESLTLSEVDVFKACIAWTKTASKQENLTREIVQATLGDLFYNIRFGSMKITEFGTLSLSYGHLFSQDEYRDIVQTISCPEFKSTLFNNNRRNPASILKRYAQNRNNYNLRAYSDSDSD